MPVPGRDIMVQAWYQGGMSVFDFTDSANPVEIAYFDRGPIDAKNLIIGGYWSAYWYNGNIYGSEIARGIDVFRLMPSEYLSQNEIDAAMLVRCDGVQRAAAAEGQSGRPSVVVAKAYLDQLEPQQGIIAERAKAVDDRARQGRRAAHRQGARRRRRRARRGSPRQVETDAAAPGAKDAARMRAHGRAAH